MCVGLVWCQRRCLQLINFISRTARELFQIILCTHVCSHIQPKNYLFLWHWAALNDSVASSHISPCECHVQSIASDRRRQVHALSICSSHNRPLIAHAIKLIEFRFCFFRIFDSVFRTIQSYSICSYLILLCERVAASDWWWLIAGWKDWSNVSINWGLRQ